jgi:hypothetical protein
MSNQEAFNLILAGKLYDQSNVPVGTGPPIEGVTKALPGTITVKSAWIEMDGVAADRTTFYTRQAWVQDPETPTCRNVTVGLVGLHIVHKTPTMPQWIWASFEHVKNAPLSSAAPMPGFTFHDGSANPMPAGPPAPPDPPNPPVPLPSTPTVPPPYNVQRLAPIDDTFASANSAWRNQLPQGSVWANYELVLVQWPGLPNQHQPTDDALSVKPTPPCFGPEHTNLVNTTMETFLQANATCTGLATCMGCHNGARSTDFIMAIPFNTNGNPDGTLPRIRQSGLNSLRATTGWGPR